MPHKKPLFDATEYNIKQIIEALSCPINRHCTRIEHDCDDLELYQHPEWLIQHFIENGGAAVFATKREAFQKLCEHIEECHHAMECELCKLHSGWQRCPIRTAGDRCMKCPVILEMQSKPAAQI